MKILPMNSVERLAVRPATDVAPRTLPAHPRNTGIVPPWLLTTKNTEATKGLVALNTGIVPPWLLEESAGTAS